MTWLPGWQYRKQLTVSASSVDSDLTNFPLCARISRVDVENHFGVASGIDLRFTASDGVTLLDHVWTGWDDDDDAGAYIKVPMLDSDDGATLYMYYGNSAGTDASNAASVLADYAAFCPLRNWASGQLDLAGGLALSTASGTPVAASNGIALNGAAILTLGTPNDVLSQLTGTGFAVSAIVWDWTNDAAYTASYIADVGNYNSSTQECIKLRIASAGDYQHALFHDDKTFLYNRYKPMSQLDDGDDFHYGVSFWRPGGYGYIDGYVNDAHPIDYVRSDSGGTLDFGTSTRAFYMGSGLVGTLAEFRVKKSLATAAWFKFENANLRTAGNQITLAGEESLPVVAGPYQVAMINLFQTDAQQAETYIPGTIAGHTYGT